MDARIGPLPKPHLNPPLQIGNYDILSTKATLNSVAKRVMFYFVMSHHILQNPKQAERDLKKEDFYIKNDNVTFPM